MLVYDDEWVLIVSIMLLLIMIEVWLFEKVCYEFLYCFNKFIGLIYDVGFYFEE